MTENHTALTFTEDSDGWFRIFGGDTFWARANTSWRAEAIAPLVEEMIEENKRVLKFLNAHLAWLACVPNSVGVSSSVLHRINQLEKVLAKLDSADD